MITRQLECQSAMVLIMTSTLDARVELTLSLCTMWALSILSHPEFSESALEWENTASSKHVQAFMLSRMLAERASEILSLSLETAFIADQACKL